MQEKPIFWGGIKRLGKSKKINEVMTVKFQEMSVFEMKTTKIPEDIPIFRRQLLFTHGTARTAFVRAPVELRALARCQHILIF